MRRSSVYVPYVRLKEVLCLLVNIHVQAELVLVPEVLKRPMDYVNSILFRVS